MKKKGHRPVILVHFRFSSKIAALNRAELMLTYVTLGIIIYYYYSRMQRNYFSGILK